MHNESAKSETPNSRLSLIRGIIPVPVITVKLQCNALHQCEIHIAALSPNYNHTPRVIYVAELFVYHANFCSTTVDVIHAF